MNPESIIIFTDGSSRGNPGPGGYAAIIVYNDGEWKVESGKWKVQELGGREEYTTNNRMELRAAIEALAFIKNQGSTFLPIQGRTLIFFSDSNYVINGITKWVHGWKKNNWMTSTKTPVENRDLWERLDSLCTIYRTEWKYVGGHIGVAGNERCDQIAQMFADLPAKIFQEQNLGGQAQTDANNIKLYSGPLEKYPIKNILNLYDISYKKQEAKTVSRARQKAKAYSYVSMVDGKIMTHTTWAECEHRVKGKPAKFKKALSLEDELMIKKLWSKKE